MNTNNRIDSNENIFTIPHLPGQVDAHPREGLNKTSPNDRGTTRAETLLSEPIHHRGAFYIFSVEDLKPQAIRMKSSPQIFEAQRNVESKEVFDTPGPKFIGPRKVTLACQVILSVII